MDKIILFNYFYRDSIIHKMEARIKILSMLIISITISVAANTLSYTILSALIIFYFFLSKLPFKLILKSIKIFFPLIFIIIIFNSFNIVNSDESILPFKVILSFDNFTQALKIVWRFVMIISLSTIITSSTSVNTFKNVVRSFLSLIPFVPEARVATIVNMTFILIPTIFNKYNIITDALLSRCIGAKKNPIRRLVYTSTPLLNEVIRNAEDIGAAMESRLFNENATAFIEKIKIADYIIFTLSIFICLASIAIYFFL